MSVIQITTSSFDVAANPALAALQDAGFEVRTNPHGRRLTEDEAAALLQDGVVGLIAGVEPLTRRVIAGSRSLKVISRCGTGLDSVDLDAAAEHGIPVLNTPDAPAVAVAEMTLGMILAALRNLALSDRRLRAGSWDSLSGGLLNGRTVGIIGCGRIGRRVADLCRAFGASVQGSDPEAVPEGMTMVPLDSLLATSDIVTLHVPGGAATRHLIDGPALGRMKPGALLVNMARGDVVDEAALLAALEDGRLRGAALDVFAEEPYAGPLTGRDDVLLTAHMGSRAEETRRMMELEAANNLFAAMAEAGLVDLPHDRGQ